MPKKIRQVLAVSRSLHPFGRKCLTVGWFRGSCMISAEVIPEAAYILVIFFLIGVKTRSHSVARNDS